VKRFVEGEERRQSLLLPESLDDYVTEDNPVRVVEVFIDELDLRALGFAGVQPAVTGRPAYHPTRRARGTSRMAAIWRGPSGSSRHIAAPPGRLSMEVEFTRA
jgi:hypothetical protein